MHKSAATPPNLPPAFVKRIGEQLGAERERFLNTYEQQRTVGLRLNTLKLQASDTHQRAVLSLFGCEPVPWCPSGYYYNEATRPGKHPYHAAGLYYIQEPSAMSAVEWLAPSPGDIVLDLAAAPGGKATQIAALLAGKGVLVANEIHPARAAVLAENLERWGAANVIVTQCSPDQLARRFPGHFDKIMLDAPCSGEGMFRKNPEAIHEWSPDHVLMCAARQLDILESAVKMLKTGGIVAYSTCTFAEEENEHVISHILQRFPELECTRMERLWPHQVQGEGHFVAILHKRGGGSEPDAAPHPASRRERNKSRSKNNDLAEAWRLFSEFAARTLPDLRLPDGEAILFGDQLYWLPYHEGTHPLGGSGMHGMHGLKVLRPGLHLAARKKNRIEPAHALALCAANGVVMNTSSQAVIPLSANDEATAAYLRGEAIDVTKVTARNPLPAWVIVAVDGLPLGWGKQSNGRINNHYPKGLRRFE